MASISNRLPEVWVSYNTPAGRKAKYFTDAYVARRFYTLKFKAGNSPAVHKEQPMSKSTKSNVAASSTEAKATKPTAKTTKPEAAKQQPAKASKPAKATEATATSSNLTGKEVEVLKALAKKPLQKGQLWDLCKAGSSVLGAGTKEGATGLLGKGFIKVEKHEDSRQLVYLITAAGKKALEKASK